VAIIEQSPRLEGRLLFMILAPNPRWLQSMRAQQEKREQQQKAKPLAPKPAAASQPTPVPAAPVAEAPKG
jgi:translation initiation factor IF-3